MENKENIIVNNFIEWIKLNRLDTLVNQYINLTMSYLYKPYYIHESDNNPYDYSGTII